MAAMLREGCSQCCPCGVPMCWATAPVQSRGSLAQNQCRHHPAPFDIRGQAELQYHCIPSTLLKPRGLKHSLFETVVHQSQPFLPSDMEHSAQPQTLKRSNAINGKLHKEKVNSVASGEWAAGNIKLSKALTLARKQDEKEEKRQEKMLGNMSRQNSFEPSISDNASADMIFQALPMSSYATTLSKKTNSVGWSRTGASGSAVAKAHVGTKTKRWGIFGRKKEDSHRPVDNFTKWDGSDRERRTYAITRSAGLMAGALLDMAESEDESVKRTHKVGCGWDVQAQPTCTARHSAVEDSVEESLAEVADENARLLDQLSQAVEPEHSQMQSGCRDYTQPRRDGRHFRRDPKPAWPDSSKAENGRRFHSLSIGDVDWSKLDTDRQLRELLQQLDEDRQSDASPADSGIDMDNDDRPFDKGKARAVSVCSSDTYHSFISYDEASTADQEAIRYSEDVELHRKDALAEVLELHYRKVLQEHEDARRAKQLQEEERIARALQEEEARIAAELASRRVCVCCGDEKHVLAFPAKAPTPDCSHISTTCIACMHTWLSSELSSKGCESLKCPECPSILDYDAIQLLSSPATFTKYEQLLLRNTLSSLPEFAWCLSPTCKSGQLNIQNGNYMECDTLLGGCGYQQCLHHRTPWHTGETYTAYDHRVSGAKAREDEAATQAILDDISKKCPGKRCGWRIQKSEGCDHMTCKKCKWQFCWECLASHREMKREGNTAHERWCKFHSKNLGVGGAVVVSWPFNAHA
ncbi:E3 ubiquitin-protein ligase RNF19B [Fulvia fulva]|nr:E3 ubiquitin-protein ligase RNF19B [Fulvia fulva]KAK4620734.1 E3 ubiquitin-protein ligase RNF19B [Fulvia fulva]WPV17301.1 E3 ubiquitin-protein ligase RNF19B [Fulvia fulva]WPV32714.1 E3 ubiquitin-protein ligase RNF19B [Fulvia fulva]